MRTTILIWFCLLVFCAKTEAADSLILKRDLEFKSSLEKKHFLAYLRDHDQTHFPYLLMGVKDSITDESVKKVTDQLNALVNSLRISGVEKRNPKRKIKDIFEFVHSAMLKKYSLVSRFEDIFTTGNYNCVTATALYSFIFEEFKIPYEIKEKPTHVYILAYPNAENIMVETTTPFFTYVNFSNEYKENFINTLKTLKLISEQEAKDKDPNTLFNTYYFTDGKISFEQLVGIHYLNDAIYRSDVQDNEGGLRQAQKAWFFYSAPKSEFLLKVMGLNVLSIQKLPPKRKSTLVVRVANFKMLGVTDDMIKGEFINLTQDVLFRNNNRTLYDECYGIFSTGIRDQELHDEIAYIYNYETGRLFYNQGNLRRAKPFFRRALNLQPNNVDMNRLFFNTLVESIRADNARSVLDTLLVYQKICPTLAEFAMFKQSLGAAMLQEAANQFLLEKPKEAVAGIQQFEEFFKLNPDIKIDSRTIAFAYNSGSRYYIERNLFQKSKEILTAGLKIDPTNEMLSERLKYLSR